MPEPAAIAAALSSIKAAIDIATLLRSSDVSLETAEMKLKIADLLGSLADVKMQVIDLQDLLRIQESQIGDLSEALEIKGDLKLKGEAYFLAGATGPDSGPYCVRCWQVDHKLRRVVRAAVGNSANCPACGTHYDRNVLFAGHQPA